MVAIATHSLMDTGAVGSSSLKGSLALVPNTTGPWTMTLDQPMKRYQENVGRSQLIIFPSAFLLFNIASWVHNLTKWFSIDLFMGSSET